MRAFIAVDFDPAIKKTLADFLKRLRKINDRDVTWSREDSLHLTVKFLGEIPEGNLPPIEAALAGVVRPLQPFPLVLKGTGHFPGSARAPRVLWVGVFEQPTLMAFQRDLDFALGKLNIAPENRPFHPHLTLGRVKAPAKLGDVLDELERYKYSDFGQMTVTKVALFESRLKPSGAEHIVRAEFPLA